MTEQYWFKIVPCETVHVYILGILFMYDIMVHNQIYVHVYMHVYILGILSTYDIMVCNQIYMYTCMYSM